MSETSAQDTTGRGPGQWWSIEVLNGPFSADRWRDGHGRALFEAAVTHGALDWSWQATEWGLVLEIEFPDIDAWVAFRQLPGVQAALDAVPDPIRGLFVFPGRGGSAGAHARLRPRPQLGAGGAPLPVRPEPIIVARAAEPLLEAHSAESLSHARSAVARTTQTRTAQAEPTQVEPRQAKTARAEPTQAEPTQAGTARAA